MKDKPSPDSLYFEVLTPVGFMVRVTVSYWALITTIKHPIMAGQEAKVMEVLQNPQCVHQSKRDTAVYLFYQEELAGRWMCTVVKRMNDAGFLITSYPTDTINEGVHIWPT